MSPGNMQVCVQETLNACLDKYRFLNGIFFKKTTLKNEGLPTISGSSTISDPFLRIRAFYKYRAKNMDEIMPWA